MKMLMKVQMPLEKFNKAVLDGTAGQKLGKILETIKPSAAYFTAENGCRGGTFIIDVDSPSRIPFYAEPFFLLFDAKVEFYPFMTPEDLQHAGLDKLAQMWT